MGRLAVYGGSFNPVHRGHIHLAEQFRLRLRLDRVVLMPAGIPPHKAAPDLAAAPDRLAMCRLAAAEAGLEVSDLELRRSGPSYTVDTLRALRGQNPGDELFLITGEDMFLTLLTWRDAPEILRLAAVCAAPRSWEGMRRMEAYAAELRAAGGRIFLQDIAYLPISSTQVRRAVREGRSIRELVPEAVAGYIESRHLYQEGLT